MASEVDICNLALSHLGQSRQITSISPPDGSAEAALCHRFYPIARGMYLEAHNWGFATRRATLAATGTPPTEWAVQYAMPSDALKIQDLFIEGDDTPQEYAVERDADTCNTVIFTNVENAEAKYTVLVTDVNKYSSTGQFAFSLLLSSFLAGPIIKGKAGKTVAKEQRNEFLVYLGEEQLNDAEGQSEQVKAEPAYVSVRVKPSSIRARR